MAYNAALNTVYNHYLTTYAPKSTSQYDSHKKSELRGIYNSIVKLNKESPLYLVDSSKESREFAVGIKENSRLLRNTIASLGGLNEEEMFNKKSAFSSNENIVSASFIGDVSSDESVPSFNIEVTALAAGQVNMGTFLSANAKADVSPDAYSFDITINDISYEFQYNVYDGETNLDLQERLSRLISNADVGINADVVNDEKGNTSLRLSSTSTGTKNDKEYIFRVTDDKTSKKSGTVDYLGLSFVSRAPSNAEFILNGEARSASSNHFTVDKLFELTLNGISPAEEGTQVGLKTDLDSLVHNVNELVTGYNSFVQSVAEYQDAHPRSYTLLNEMNSMARSNKASLENLGFIIGNNGQLTLDENEFKSSIEHGEDLGQLSAIRHFTNSVLRKTNQISLNPMEYVDKTIVAYKNPGHNFATPYVTSNYSGMMFNSYC